MITIRLDIKYVLDPNQILLNQNPIHHNMDIASFQQMSFNLQTDGVA